MTIYQKLYKRFEGSGIGNYEIIVLLRRLYISHKTRRPIKINGHCLWLDKKDTLNIILNGTHEPETISYIMKHAKGIGLDLGANIGFHSLAMAQRCNIVYAVEPLPYNFELLERNIKENNLHNIKALNFAAGAKTEKKTLYQNRRGEGSTSFIDQGKWNGERQKVNVVRLDDFFKNRRKPYIIKMDIEGWEEEAILGGRKTFKHAKIVIFEDNQELLARKGRQKDTVIRLMENMGFIIRKRLDGNYLAVRA